ncbi:MAG TPA: small multi-drug export protein [Acidimicrobiales bacterium]|nr:small multi-drug export protein [Acidimicrobiales bacterium]
MDVTFDAGSWWSYLLVFLAAATPVIEVLVVIPAAVLAGMPAAPVAAVAFLGNLTTVALVVVAGDRLLRWWRRRRRREPEATPPSRRAERARRLAQRWGVPGLALIAPISTGTHVAAVAALATGARRGRVLGWMAGGLVVWAVAVAVGAARGIDVVR